MERSTGNAFGVYVIAILQALNGVVALVSAVAILTGSAGLVEGGQGATIAVMVQGLFGLAMLYLAYGMWTRQSWAWITTILIQGINAVFALFTGVSTGAIGSWISLALAVVIILYLIQPSVKDDFTQRRTEV